MDPKLVTNQSSPEDLPHVLTVAKVTFKQTQTGRQGGESVRLCRERSNFL